MKNPLSPFFAAAVLVMLLELGATAGLLNYLTPKDPTGKPGYPSDLTILDWVPSSPLPELPSFYRRLPPVTITNSSEIIAFGYFAGETNTNSSTEIYSFPAPKHAWPLELPPSGQVQR